MSTVIETINTNEDTFTSNNFFEDETDAKRKQYIYNTNFDQASTIINNETSELIGIGTENTVYKVTDSSGNEYILRVNYSNATGRNKFISNVKKHLSLQVYPFIIPLLYAETFNPHESGKRLGYIDGDNVMIMPYIAGKSLDKYEASSLDHTAVYNIILQLKTALETMSLDGYVHRDIKPENIFISSKGKVYIIDYDTVCNVRKGDRCTNLNPEIIGTRAYARPDSITGSPSIDREGKQTDCDAKVCRPYIYTTKYDIWSLGKTISTKLAMITKSRKDDIRALGEAMMIQNKIGGGPSKKRRSVKRTRYTRRKLKAKV